MSIPVVFVAGLLGAGKSTTVASLLDSRKEGTVGVLVQELSDHNIDTKLLQGGETMPLSPQYWIQSAGTSLHTALLEMVGAGDFNAILIECSGAIPLSTTLHESKIQDVPGVHYAGSISIIDANHIGRCTHTSEIPAVLKDALEHADLILLNKIDLVPVMRRTGMQAHIRRLVTSRQVPVRAARYGRISLNELLQSLPKQTRSNPESVQAADIPSLVHDVFFSRQPFISARLYNWLQEITSNPPKGLIRAKGYFHIDTLPDYILAFDIVHGHIEIGIEGMWWASISKSQLPDEPEIQQALQAHPEYGDRIQELVFIGSELDVQAIKDDLTSMLGTQYEKPQPDDPMHNALRKQLAQLASSMSKRSKQSNS